MWNPINWYKGLRAGFANGWAAMAKFGGRYKALPSAATKGSFIAAGKNAAGQAFDGLSVAVGGVVIGFLGYFGIKKTDDATKAVGSLVMVGGIVAIVTGAVIAFSYRKR